jgi:PAS domain S-box-containing protein
MSTGRKEKSPRKGHESFQQEQAAYQTAQEDLEQEAARRLGLKSNLFSPSPELRGPAAGLWAFARQAYLDSPLPSLFKERLFVYLSRSCPARYSVVRHAGYLMGKGRPAGDPEALPQTAEQLISLLSRPVLYLSGIDPVLSRMETSDPGAQIPEPETGAEDDLMDVLAVLFSEPLKSERARNAVRHAYGEQNLQLLSGLLSYIKTEHYWTEAHPEITYEPDMAGFLSGPHALAALLLDHPAGTSPKPGNAALTLRNHEAWLYEALVQNVQDYAIFMVDAEGIITRWTEGAKRVKGYSQQEVLGRHIAMFYPSDELAAGQPFQELQEAAMFGRSEREGWRLRKGGKRFLVNEIATAIWDSQQNLLGFAKISRDITEHKKAEQVLRETRRQLQIVMESISDHAIITSDTHNIITGWNPGAQHMFGYPAEEAMGQSGALIFTKEDLESHEPEKETRTARLHGRAIDERYHVRKDGSQLYVSGVMSPLYDAGGELMGYVKVARDLTERKRMEQALKEADSRKDEFMAMLGHELRNPLAPVQNTLQILKITHGTDEALSSSLELMSRQVSHMVRLVNDLLDMTRILKGKVNLKPERIDLVSVVRRAVEMSQPLFPEGSRSLTVSLPDMPVYVNGDITRIIQVVSNLLNNGAKYTNPGGQVHLKLRLLGSEAILSVKDDGIGIAGENLKNVFESFVQIGATIDRSQGGLGLGLSMVKQLVELHGGKVHVFSKGLGHGSEFIIYLPLVD